MTTDITLSRTPEEEELARKQAELAELGERLAERELEVTTLRAELSAFERRYIQIVGLLYAELDGINAQIAATIAAAAPNDAEAQQRATEAREKATDSARATAGAEGLAEQPVKFEPPESLKKLYREVARRIHPDLAMNEDDRKRRTALMARANHAYELGDEGGLRAILNEWESSPEAVEGEGTAAELVRVIRKIAQVERRLQGIGVEFDELQASDLSRLKMKVDEAEQGGRDLLGEMAAALEREIQEEREKLPV